MARLGPDIDSEFEKNIKHIQRNKTRRIITLVIGIILMFFIVIFISFSSIPGLNEIGGLPIIITFIVMALIIGFVFKIEPRIRITEVIAYYFFVISDQVKDLDKEKPYTSRDLKNKLKDFYNHIGSYLNDYSVSMTYYIDFDYSDHIEKTLNEMQIILKKINTLSNKIFSSKNDISTTLMAMSQDIYKNKNFSDKFNESIKKLLHDIEKETETQFHINIKSLTSIIGGVPNLIKYIIVFFVIAGLIYTLLPIGFEAKISIIAVVAAALYGKYKPTRPGTIAQ